MKVGDRVYWNDPADGLCSCFGTIIHIQEQDETWEEGTALHPDTVVSIETDAGGGLEAFPHELVLLGKAITVYSTDLEVMSQAVAALRLAAKQRETLTQLEYCNDIGYGPCCPVCSARKNGGGHYPDCWLAAALHGQQEGASK